MYIPQFVRLVDEDILRIKSLAQTQTIAYGHDRGFFSLGRTDSSHEIGFEGEVGFIRWCKSALGKREPGEVGLNEIGAEFGAYIMIEKVRYNIHIKTGRWNKWPQPHWYFGVHYGQGIENSGCPVILVSYLREEPSVVRIEGFMPSDILGRQRIIHRGECFPGMSYPSRTDNWLTRFSDYRPIGELPDYLKNCSEQNQMRRSVFVGSAIGRGGVAVRRDEG